MSNNEYREAQQQADDRCKCGQETNICAPWLYMGPWHDERCWLFGPMPPIEELLAGECYAE